MSRQSRLPSITKELRAVKLDRSAIPADSRSFTGHAAVYNQRTAIGNPLTWGFFEQVAPGCFDKSLRDGDVVQLADHDTGKPIARMSAGTLRLASDTTGLAVDSDIVDTSYGNDLIANVRAENITGMSFGFQTIEDDWETETVETKDGMKAQVEVRTLLEVCLIEVSTTAFPAYTGTDAGLRAIRDAALSTRARSGAHQLRPSCELLAALGEQIRAGAVLSAANLSILQQVLDLISTADDAVDEAQPLLANLMGVANPDAGDDDKGGEDEAKQGFPLDLQMRYFALASQFA